MLVLVYYRIFFFFLKKKNSIDVDVYIYFGDIICIYY